MAIYSPEVRLSEDDKELLHILANLILSSTDERIGRNCSANYVALSDREAVRLLELLQNFVSSRKFIEGAYLIERVFNRSSSLDDGNLRDIYLTWKRRHGRSRALATAQWAGFLARLGIRKIAPGDPWHRSPVTPMTYSHFVKMEQKLALSAQIHPTVRSIISAFIRQQEYYVERIRSAQETVPIGHLSILPTRLMRELSPKLIERGLQKPLSTNQIIGVAVIVMDFSALFTTRDWDVSGFISTVAGAAPAVSEC